MFDIEMLLQLIDDGCDFHEVGPRPHDAQKPDHWKTPSAIAPAMVDFPCSIGPL
jgi:hypothetical protein